MLVTIRNPYKGYFSQFLATFTGTIMAISDGMHNGWSAPIIPILLSKDRPIEATKGQTDFMETILMIGAFCGLPTTIYLINKIGRKKSIMVSSTTNLITWIIIGLGNRIEYYYVARFFAGMAGNMSFVAAPMYIAEIADKKIRGFLASVIYLMLLLGVVLVYIIVPFVPFYVTPIIGGGLIVFQLSIFPFMPDSPYYLISKNKHEKAISALVRLRKLSNVEDELVTIQSAVERQNSNERGKILDLILVKCNRKAFLIMMILNGAQSLAGFTVIIMNMHSILEAAGTVYMSSSTAAIIFSIIMLFAALLSSLLVDKFGRKILLITSCTLTGFCLLFIAIYFNLKYAGYDVLFVSWIPIASVMVYGATFKFGLGMVPIIITAEIFSTQMKAIGMTVADAMYVGFAIISLEIYHLLSDACGIHVPFYIFTTCCICTTFFTVFYIPETKGKTLDEIQIILKGEGG